MMIRKMLACTMAAALLLAACGGSDDEGSAADPALVSALAAELASEDSPFDQETAQCAAERIIGGISTDRLLELGINAESMPEADQIDFTDDEVDLVVDSIGDCGDLSDLMAESLAADGVIPADKAECFGNEIDDDVMKDAFRITLRDSTADPSAAFQEAFLEAVLACEIPLG